MITTPVRVKDALKSGYYKKNYLIHVYSNGSEIKTLDNTYLVSESVKFDERMCSGTELKFGLCEGSSLEFQYFNYNSVLGCRLYVEVSVQYKDSDNTLKWHSIPLGWFDVDECSRQASTGIIKVTAYNKLKSTYLDKPINAELINYVSTSGTNLYKILQDMLSGFGIIEEGEVDVPKSVTYEGPFAVGFSYATQADDTFQRLTNGKRGVMYYARWSVTTAAEWTSDKYYKFLFHSEIIKQFIYNSFWGDLPSVGSYIWTGPNVGALTGTAELYPNYINGNYEYSHFFRGMFRMYINSVITDYPIYPNGGDISVDYVTNIAESSGGGITLDVYIPVMFDTDYDIGQDGTNIPATMDLTSSITEEQREQIYNRVASIGRALSAVINITCGKLINSISTIKLTKSFIASITSDITLRDLQTAEFELQCQYGKLNRVSDIFSGVTLNNGYLYPADNLYPADSLYPAGSVEGGYPAMYSKLWADENNVRSFRYLIITYKTTETISGETREVEKKLQRTVNANGTDDYNMSDNWLFRNLVWTTTQVGTLADEMVTRMQNIKWFPFEMWCAGLPYLEAGDQIEIWAADGVHPSYILNRTMNGIQNLQDTMINGELDIF